MSIYLAAIKEKVCSHCIERGPEGECRISPDKICTIESNYDRIVSAILSSTSERYEDYVGALRRNVCQDCSYGNPKSCDDRDQVECPLDRYYPLIVDAVEAIGIANIRQTYGGLTPEP